MTAFKLSAVPTHTSYQDLYLQLGLGLGLGLDPHLLSGSLPPIRVRVRVRVRVRPTPPIRISTSFISIEETFKINSR